MSIINLEKKYCECMDTQQEMLKKTFQEMKSSSTISLRKRDITKAILFRMKSYYETQDKIKKFLNKRYSPAASDLFVETVVFYLKLFLEMRKLNFEVHSERQIQEKRGSPRPDISIWKKDKVMAIIECKTRFSRNRHTWEMKFREREEKLKDIVSDAEVFLLVMTKDGWPGFEEKDKRVGKQFFTLSEVGPKDITENNISEIILNPIEDLFGQILHELKKEKKVSCDSSASPPS